MQLSSEKSLGIFLDFDSHQIIPSFSKKEVQRITKNKKSTLVSEPSDGTFKGKDVEFLDGSSEAGIYE